MISTKQGVEDVLANVGDVVARDQKSFTNMSPERLFFVYSRSKRLSQTDTQYSAVARSFSRNRQTGFGLAQPIKQEVPCLMKKLCQAGKTDLPADVHAREWKAAGQGADCTSASIMVVLRKMAPQNFPNMSGLWCAALLQEGQLFEDQSSGDFVLSLGPVQNVALGWKAQQVAEFRLTS